MRVLFDMPMGKRVAMEISPDCYHRGLVKMVRNPIRPFSLIEPLAVTIEPYHIDEYTPAGYEYELSENGVTAVEVWRIRE